MGKGIVLKFWIPQNRHFMFKNCLTCVSSKAYNRIKRSALTLFLRQSQIMALLRIPRDWMIINF